MKQDKRTTTVRPTQYHVSPQDNSPMLRVISSRQHLKAIHVSREQFLHHHDQFNENILHIQEKQAKQICPIHSLSAIYGRQHI